MDVIGTTMPIDCELHARYVIGLEELYQRVIESPESAAVYCQAVASWRHFAREAGAASLEADRLYAAAGSESEGKNDLARVAAALAQPGVYAAKEREHDLEIEAKAYQAVVVWLQRGMERRPEL